MMSKTVVLRLLLAALAAVPILAMAPGPGTAGDFRYEPTSEEFWPKNIVRAVQSRLAELGFDPGPIDGLLGPKTKQGIMEFQRAHHLEVDGKITNRLIGSLGLD